MLVFKHLFFVLPCFGHSVRNEAKYYTAQVPCHTYVVSMDLIGGALLNIAPSEESIFKVLGVSEG